MPLERDINIAVNGPFLVKVANQEWAIYGNVDISLYSLEAHASLKQPSSRSIFSFRSQMRFGEGWMDVAVFACVFQMVAHIIYHHMRGPAPISTALPISIPFLPSQDHIPPKGLRPPGDVVLLDGSPDFTVRATSQIFRVGFQRNQRNGVQCERISSSESALDSQRSHLKS